MNPIRIVLRAALPAVLLLALLAPTALAQDTDEPEEKTVIVEIRDGQTRVVVDGEELTGEEAEKYLHEYMERDEGHGIRRYKFRTPNERAFIHGDGINRLRFRPGQGDEPFAYFFGEGDDFTTDDIFFRGGPGAVFAEVHDGFGSMKDRAEIARMDAESRRLARALREAEGAERERLEAELREKLAEIFARKQELRAEHLEEMRERLRRLEAEQQERAAAQSEIIERRLKTLLGERHKYDW